jgi:integrase
MLEPPKNGTPAISQGEGFPKTVKSGAAAVTVYRRLLKSKASANRAYAQFTIYYQLNGKEYRLYRNNLKAAMALAREKALEIERGHVSTLTLVGAEMESYLAAMKLTAEEGLTLEAAVRDYVAAYSLVKPTSLIQVARQHQLQGGRVIEAKTIEELLPEFLKSKRPKNLPEEGGAQVDRHYQTLKNDLGRFRKSFSGRLLDVSSSEIDLWLSGLKVTDRHGNVKPDAKHVSERTRRNIYGSISNFFNWAKRKNFLPRERLTEIDYVDKPGKASHIPRSFSASETQRLLDAVPARLVPIIVLCAFGGVRRAEVERLDWTDVRWDHDDIQIWADDAKTQARRLPPLLPNAKLWLKPFRNCTGPICPSPDRFTQVTEMAKKLGLVWSHDVLRDGFISNRAAILKDLPRVAYEAGNSQRVIKESYLKLVSERDAKAYFEVKPKPGWKPNGSTSKFGGSAK